MSKSIHGDPTLATSASTMRPETLKVTVGDITTRIEAAKMWTMSGIEFKNTMMATQDSAYGVVLTIRGVGHLGTAHFLDVPGKPGEVEKENVSELRFFMDDKPLAVKQPKMDIAGKSFRMERKSTIRALELESTLDIRDGVLIETAHMRAAQPIDLNAAHLMMYAWTPAATKYVYGDDTGIKKRGTFLPDGAETSRVTEKSLRWVGIFEPASGKGAVSYISKCPATADAWMLCVDGPGIYRKMAFETFVEKIIPAGFDGTFQTVVGFFNATETDWEQQAQKRVNELKFLAAGLDN